jgi:F-type H+/Na+-transporting ATPase subunit alpha
MKTKNITNNNDLAEITLDISKEISLIQNATLSPKIVSTGKVKSVLDGVAQVTGLTSGMVGEKVEFESGTTGMILNLTEDEAGIAIFGSYKEIKYQSEVVATGQILSVNASYNLLGRIVNPLIEPIDGKGAIKSSKSDKQMPVEKVAPGVIERQDVRTPFQTGIKAIDILVPIGRGQRQLIIGDRGTGKTALVLDSIINQAKINKNLISSEKRIISIYVSIGQKDSKLTQVAAKLAEHDALNETIIISAGAADPASLQFIAPFAGAAIAEYFMERGEDVLIVYDDLSKHAWAYRELSLLLKRPSGREAYPGDIFYLHSRLLERAARMSDKNGGGSITALPVIETLAGDISAYIPTNVISITDGQIYLEPDLFYSGMRPAISVGLSVSRVGGDAQTKAMKQIAGTLKLDLAQYRELAAFAQFGSDLDEATKDRLNRGAKVTEILKQKQFSPLSVTEQVASVWAAVNGHLDDIAKEKVEEFLKQWLLTVHKTPLENNIKKDGRLTDEAEKIMKKEIIRVKKIFAD